MRTCHKVTTAQAIGLGMVAGMRSLRLPALLARRRRSTAASPLRWMAAAELLADKAPFTPPRTRPVSVLGRMVAGAGSALALTPRGQPAAGPAVTAAGAALVSTFVFYRVRTMVPGPGWVAALLEDALAAGLGRRLVRA